MNSKIHKLEINFDPIQDRLILKFHTEDLSEYRLWLTRRFVKLLWGALTQLLKQEVKPKEKKIQEAQKISEAYEKEQSMKQSQFVQKYASNVQISKTPLGPDPILVSKIQLKQQASGIPLLCLHPENGQGFEISAHSMIIHALCKLLSEASQKTDWDLKLVVQNEPPAPETELPKS